jgi:hypothetical protein
MMIWNSLLVALVLGLPQDPGKTPPVEEAPPVEATGQDAEKDAAEDAAKKEAKDEEQEAEEEGEFIDPKDIELPHGPPGAGGAQQEAAEEILQLFKEVDKKMRAIDELLFDIGAGEVPVVLPPDSGLGELLGLTKTASEDVVQDIDKILQLAEEMSQSQNQSQSSGSRSQQPPPPGGKPEEQEGQPNQEKPSPGQEPGEQPQQPEQGDPGKDPNSPESPEESGQEGENTTTGAANDTQTGPGSNANLSERWGELPERVRETFRSQGGDDLPLFYRDWIESYYRHLNRGDSGGPRD